ncbi:MAG: YegP family protein [Actinomycetota bacterium]
MPGKFVLKKGASGKYHFNLHASNGQIVATSESYERKQSAVAGIESVKKHAADAEIDDQTES